MTMQKISNKSKDALYSAVHEEIMRARIKIAMLMQESPALGRDIDNILSDLVMSCPQKAIDVFKT